DKSERLFRGKLEALKMGVWDKMLRPLRQKLRVFYLRVLLAAFSACVPTKVTAQGLYNHQLPFGPGAGSLGGAFTAIADDPSAVIYNPGGVAFIEADKSTLSHNTYLQARYRINKALLGSDYKSTHVNTP